MTSLDGDQLRIFLNACEEKLLLPAKKFEAVSYESVESMNVARRGLRRLEDGLRFVPLVGPTLRGTLRALTSSVSERRANHFHAHHWYQDLALRELRARKRDIVKEKAISIDSFLAAGALLFGFAKSASKIDSAFSGGGGGGKKSGGHGH
ncbi:MAG: hypothetical protein UZ22_OP11002000334 [Microgenomates bacterium OLB23]|nr:MAG: hypothetical protein UZ22_OP11002000334 [Microgenomates bacterium OLB23]